MWFGLALLSSVTAVLQSGINEVKIYGDNPRPQLTPQRFGEHILQFCTDARQENCDVVLVGPQPIETRVQKPVFGGAIIKDELLVEYGGIMRQVAAGQHVPFVDLRTEFTRDGHQPWDFLDDDGYHPNPRGHAIIADAVYKALPFTNEAFPQDS
jgi:lysophospholipase L1-like esterase